MTITMSGLSEIPSHTRNGTRCQCWGLENDTSTRPDTSNFNRTWPWSRDTKDDWFMPWLHGLLVPICIKIGPFVFKLSCSQVWQRI